MAGTKGRSAHHKKMCKVYQDMEKWRTNKRRKLERHLKKYPNDKQAAQTLEREDEWTTIRKPHTHKWSKRKRHFAEMARKAEAALRKEERQYVYV